LRIRYDSDIGYWVNKIAKKKKKLP
jgi:hypothetical protein